MTKSKNMALELMLQVLFTNKGCVLTVHKYYFLI